MVRRAQVKDGQDQKEILFLQISQARILEGLPFPPPEALPHPSPGTEPESPELQADSLPSEPTGKPLFFSNMVFLRRQYSTIYSSWTYCKNIHRKYLRSKAVRLVHTYWLCSRRYTKQHPMAFCFPKSAAREWKRLRLRFPRSLRICESHPTWTWITLNGQSQRNTNLLNLPWQENLTYEWLWFPLQSWITLQNSD